MFDLDFSGKNFLVTGGTRGIGRSVSLMLLKLGAKVLVNYVRNAEAADGLSQELSSLDFDADQLVLIKADLTREKGLETLVSSAEVHAPIHGVVHCAATGVHQNIEEMSLRHYDWTMNLNVRAYFNLLIQSLPFLSPSASLVALSSEGAERVVPHYALIGSSKAALESFSRYLALEWVERGIRSNIVSPGNVLTEAWDAFPDKNNRVEAARKRVPGGNLTTSLEVANVVAFLLSDLASGINGQTIIVDHGERLVV